MKKKILAGMAVILCIGMAGCNKENAGGTPADNPATVSGIAEPEVTITVTPEIEIPEDEVEKEQEGLSTEVKELIEAVANTREKSTYEKLYSHKTALETVPEISGEWNRTNVHSSYSSVITISSVTEEGFDFTVGACYFSHSGALEASASWITGNIAVCKIEDTEIFNTTNYVLFVWEENILRAYASARSGEFGFGMNVDMDGEYSAGQPVYTNADILNKTFSETQLAFLKENLTETQYENLVFATENGVVQISEEGEKKTISGFMPTMGEYGYDVKFINDEISEVSFPDGSSYRFEN